MAHRSESGSFGWVRSLCHPARRARMQGTNKVLEVVEAKAGGTDPNNLVKIAARSTFEQGVRVATPIKRTRSPSALCCRLIRAWGLAGAGQVVGTGLLMTGLFALYGVGFAAFSVRAWFQRNEDIVYYRCDGGDKTCCEGRPNLAYRTNDRGYETSERKFMDTHLAKRQNCREVEPVVIVGPRPFW